MHGSTEITRSERTDSILAYYNEPHDMEETAEHFGIKAKTVEDLLYRFGNGVMDRPIPPGKVLKFCTEWEKTTKDVMRGLIRHGYCVRRHRYGSGVMYS